MQPNLIDLLKDLFREVVRDELTLAQQRDEKVAPALLDTKQAAEFLNVPATWIGTAAREGKLKSVKLGSYVRFRIEDLREFIEQQK